MLKVAKKAFCESIVQHKATFGLLKRSNKDYDVEKNF